MPVKPLPNIAARSNAWFAYNNAFRNSIMKNEFTAVVERDGEWYVAYCPEIPGANGQGRTIEESKASLADAIALILEDRREEGLRGAPSDAVQSTVTVE